MLVDGGKFVTLVGVSIAVGLSAGCLAFQRLLSTTSEHTSEYESLAVLRTAQFTFMCFKLSYYQTMRCGLGFRRATRCAIHSNVKLKEKKILLKNENTAVASCFESL